MTQVYRMLGGEAFATSLNEVPEGSVRPHNIKTTSITTGLSISCTVS